MDLGSGFTGKAVAEGGRGSPWQLLAVGTGWLVGTNSFFQGPKGGPEALATPKDPTRPPSLRLGEARRPSLTWNHRLPRLPPAMSPQGLPETRPPAPTREPHTPAANRCTNYQAGSPPPPVGAAGDLPPGRVLLRRALLTDSGRCGGDALFQGETPARAPHTRPGGPLGSQG
ncbi:hypothetical protein NN561_000052 [Cricetulus griseus]